MPHIDEVKILRKRAKAFLKTSETAYQDGEYDLTVYLCEQAIQLHLKSILLEELGDYPRTHSLTYLFQLLQKIEELRNLYNIYKDNKQLVTFLEDAYIATRYLPREYSKE
ncbi:HEPN domain-containing protein [Thermofilum sp.]|uniref:HEPN domain-containing protein n=1 Tax=Thermofilum sp. TaxID=1961369 RepID=UPI0031644B56